MEPEVARIARNKSGLVRGPIEGLYILKLLTPENRFAGSATRARERYEGGERPSGDFNGRLSFWLMHWARIAAQVSWP